MKGTESWERRRRVRRKQPTAAAPVAASNGRFDFVGSWTRIRHMGFCRHLVPHSLLVPHCCRLHTRQRGRDTRMRGAVCCTRDREEKEACVPEANTNALVPEAEPCTRLKHFLVALVILSTTLHSKEPKGRREGMEGGGVEGRRGTARIMSALNRLREPLSSSESGSTGSLGKSHPITPDIICLQ